MVITDCHGNVNRRLTPILTFWAQFKSILCIIIDNTVYKCEVFELMSWWLIRITSRYIIQAYSMPWIRTHCAVIKLMGSILVWYTTAVFIVSWQITRQKPGRGFPVIKSNSAVGIESCSKVMKFDFSATSGVSESMKGVSAEHRIGDDAFIQSNTHKIQSIPWIALSGHLVKIKWCKAAVHDNNTVGAIVKTVGIRGRYCSQDPLDCYPVGFISKDRNRKNGNIRSYVF